jgi:CRP/FNR family transcriptional regulator
MTDTEPTTEEFLARAPLFARLERRSLRKLAELCVPRDFEAGSVMISEGDTGLGLFVIMSGRVEITKGVGDEAVRLATMERGDLLGEMALIDDRPRSASAVALEETRCLLITRASFQNLAEQDPEIAWCLLPTLAERIRRLQQQMIDAGTVASEPRETRAPATAPPVAPAATTPDEKDTDRDPLLSLMRGQYALAIAAAAGLRGMATAMERFLRELADESDLDDAEDADEVVSGLPSSLLAATAAGLESTERIPEQLLERYRRYRDGEGDS